MWEDLESNLPVCIGIGMHTRALMENDKWHVNSRAKWVSPEMTKKTLLATGEHSRGTEVSTNPAYSRFSYYKQDRRYSDPKACIG